MRVGAVIEWSQVVQVVWVSLVAGVGATAVFSLVVYGSSRAGEARRGGDNPAPYGALAVLGLVVLAAIVVYAITVILQKN